MTEGVRPLIINIPHSKQSNLLKAGVLCKLKNRFQVCLHDLGVVDSAQLKPINGNGKKSKKKSYNYASVDCGAEVISVNPESTVSY